MIYQRFVGGDYKDLGTPLRKIEDDERKILQEKINKMQDFFIEEIAQNRKLPKSEVKKLATGIFYLGSEAKQLGLVDEIGGKKEAIDYLKKELNISEASIKEYKVEKTLLDVLSGLMNENFFQIGRGLGSTLQEKERLEVYT